MYLFIFLFACVHIKERSLIRSLRVSFQRCMCSLGRSGDIIFIILGLAVVVMRTIKEKEKEIEREKLRHGVR